MNFPCIGMHCTVPLPVSSLAAEDKIFKMEPQYFLAFQNSAEELKELFVVPSMQISAQFLNQWTTFQAGRKRFEVIPSLDSILEPSIHFLWLF